MDRGSMPTERSRSEPSESQGQGPLAMAEQQAAARAAADGTHTQAPAHGGARTRTFYSMGAAEEHIRQQDTTILEQARNLETLSTRIDSISIQLAQLLSLVRHRDVGDRSADQGATSAPEVTTPTPRPEPSPTAAFTRQLSADVPSVGENIPTDPDRQTRREFLGRDRMQSAPAAPGPPPNAIPRVTPPRP